MDMRVCYFSNLQNAGSAAENVDVCTGDDRVMLCEVLAENYQRLHRRLACHLYSPELASECLHDAWLKLRDIAAPSAIQNPEAYVYRVACNLALDHLRHHRPWMYVGDAETELAFLADTTPGPDHIAEMRSELGAIDRALKGLSRRHRDILISLRLEDATRQEVAARYDISLRSVDKMIRQASLHCAQHIGRPIASEVNVTRCSTP